MRALAKIAVVAFLAAVGYMVWWRMHAPNEPAAATAQQIRDAVAQGKTEVVLMTTQSGESQSPVVREPVSDYSEQFDSTNDLAPFAEIMHKRAMEGDDAAQYWLYRALQRCGPMYDAVFNVDPALPDKPPLRLDEAVADEEANPRLGADEIRELHGQCEQLREVDPARFGDASGWLRKAAGTGYPLAQVRRAAEIAVGLEPAANRAEARELMLAAVKSGDPDVIQQTGAVAQMLASGESERERHEWVWEVAACQRGANCGPATEWVRGLCAVDRNCQPYETAIDVIRRRVGAQMPEIEEEARKLNAHIDAREWGELGL
jgi:hypothetical protein